MAREPYFRWHDAGDIQGLWHLKNIVEVAKRTPEVHHWLPTREYKTVATYRKLYGEFPDNLVVRLSAHMIDMEPPSGYGLPTSTVVTDGSETCRAQDRDNHCGPCRACWMPEVANVSYPKH